MDNKNKTIFLAISIMFIICTCFTSLSFSYFINPSTTETDVLTSSLVSNELTYDENRILAPNETRVVSLNITSYNSFDMARASGCFFMFTYARAFLFVRLKSALTQSHFLSKSKPNQIRFAL